MILFATAMKERKETENRQENGLCQFDAVLCPEGQMDAGLGS